jgi:predicted ABC-type ATPase
LSLLFDFLDKRPLIIALAGSNGAGKSTFYDSYLADGGLRFINADELSASLVMLPYDAAELAASSSIATKIWVILISSLHITRMVR